MNKTIFVLEDDVHIQELLNYNLSRDGYSVKLFDDAESFFSCVDLNSADLFILDIMLPGAADGYQVCRRLRENEDTRNTPVIFLTAKSEEFDAVLGLELGAEDYIRKPFGVRELLARIRVIMRRDTKRAPTPQALKSPSDLSMDLERHMVFRNGREISLPLKEFELLRILMDNPGKVLTRDQLLEKVWGFDYAGETRTVDVHVRHLRQKIEDNDKNPKYILTIRGIGYKFKENTVL